MTATMDRLNVSGKQMERYYNAGYYLIKKRPIDFGNGKEKTVSTCSGCINLTVFDTWCFSGTIPQLDKKDKLELELNDDRIGLIQKWTYDKCHNQHLKFWHTFPDIKMAKEFKDLFYKDRMDIDLYSLEFSETDKNFLLEDFTPGKNREFNYNNGAFGLREYLLIKSDETNDSISDFLGYDFIGVEGDGSFHSFYCHGITQELIDKFGLTLNKNGLFDKIIDPKSIRDYLNDQETRVEPVPWYIVKVKLIDNANS